MQLTSVQLPYIARWNNSVKNSMSHVAEILAASVSNVGPVYGTDWKVRSCPVSGENGYTYTKKLGWNG